MADLLLWKKKHLELNFEFPNCPMISVAINNDNTVQNISGAPSQISPKRRLQKTKNDIFGLGVGVQAN